MRVERRKVHVDSTFADFYLGHFSRLVALATAVAGDATFAEDIVQDAMGKAHDRWPELDGYDNPVAWVRRAVINKSIDRKRRILREAKALARLGPGQPRASFQPRSDDELWSAVQALPARQRAAIALFYMEGYQTNEIAEVLGCAEATARTLLHRARATLRLELDTDHRGAQL